MCQSHYKRTLGLRFNTRQNSNAQGRPGFPYPPSTRHAWAAFGPVGSPPLRAPPELKDAGVLFARLRLEHQPFDLRLFLQGGSLSRLVDLRDAGRPRDLDVAHSRLGALLNHHRKIHHTAHLVCRPALINRFFRPEGFLELISFPPFW